MMLSIRTGSSPLLAKLWTVAGRHQRVGAGPDVCAAVGEPQREASHRARRSCRRIRSCACSTGPGNPGSTVFERHARASRCPCSRPTTSPSPASSSTRLRSGPAAVLGRVEAVEARSDLSLDHGPQVVVELLAGGVDVQEARGRRARRCGRCARPRAARGRSSRLPPAEPRRRARAGRSARPRAPRSSPSARGGRGGPAPASRAGRANSTTASSSRPALISVVAESRSPSSRPTISTLIRAKLSVQDRVHVWASLRLPGGAWTRSTASRGPLTPPYRKRSGQGPARSARGLRRAACWTRSRSRPRRTGRWHTATSGRSS